jgi:hypothetical protein
MTNPRRLRLLPVITGVLALMLSSLLPVAGAAPNDPPAPQDNGAQPNNPPTPGSGAQPSLPSVVPVCPGPADPDTARCHSRRRTDRPGAEPAPPGGAPQPARTGGAAPDALGNNGAYDPAYLRSAYNISSTSTRTVAIVDAFDDRTAESDLKYYRSYFGLPECTTANGCFRKVNQNGQQGNYPRSNTSWAQEIALDLEMVSAICPNCKILLVEASSNSFSNLGAAVDTAARLGAAAISNSYGGGEFSSETGSGYEGHYNHSGIAITVSSGDNGYGVEFPAASRYVTAVGGTTLNQSSNTGSRNATETVWSGSGSGCSAYVPKPSWQKDGGCSRRTVADVAAVADPSTGVWVYYNGGWYIFGGTSVASPIIASVYALAGNSVSDGSYPYGHASSLNDVKSGSDGSCGGSYLCTGGTGYDGPTGNGTPNGTGGF